jgi:hypothetical protein
MKMKADSKIKMAATSLVCLGMLSACSPASPRNSADDSQSGVSQAQPASASQQMLKDMGATLRTQSASSGVALTEAQILALLTSGQSALSAAGLLGSSDFNVFIPVLLQGLTQGVGGLNITNSAQLSQLLSLIGNGTLSSLLGSGNSISSDLISTITNSLFKNLPLAGVTSGNLSDIVGSLMNSLIVKVGQSGNGSVSDLSGIIQSLMSGAMTGVGGLPNFGSIDLNTILQQIASGAVGGLAGITLPGGLSSVNLQTLLSAILSGSQSGLLQVIAGHLGTGLDLNSLLQSIVQGQLSGLQGLPVNSSILQTLIAFLLSYLA